MIIVMTIMVLLITGCTTNSDLENLKGELDKMNQTENNTLSLKFKTEINQVKEVVEETNIDKNNFSYNDYTCLDYSYDLVSKLRENGIYACATGIYHETGAHSNVAFKTNDDKVVFVEPMNDKVVKDLEVGDDYCERFDWSCNWTINYIKTCFDRESKYQNRSTTNVSENLKRDKGFAVESFMKKDLIGITSLN